MTISTPTYPTSSSYATVCHQLSTLVTPYLLDMRITVKQLKRLIIESIEDDLGTVEVGDVLDVDTEYAGRLSVRVIELVDDVRAVTGYQPGDKRYMPDAHTDRVFQGPGFVGDIDPSSGESGKLVFSLQQVVPGSKAKGYFPRLGDEDDEDEYGRPMQNPYRQMAREGLIVSPRRGWRARR